MASRRDQILARYLEAAKKLADAPLPQLTGPTEPSQDDSLDPNGPVGSEAMDAHAVAVGELLQRQVLSIIKMHQSFLEESKEPHGVNEALLLTRLDDLASISMSKFYSYRFDRLPYHWRQLYTDTLILTTHYHVLPGLFDPKESLDGALDLVVELLDRALITAGGAGKILGAPWIEKTLELLEDLSTAVGHNDERPSKRVKTDNLQESSFPAREPYGRPQLSAGKECPRHKDWTLEKFEDYMNEGKGEPLPVVFTDLNERWPALHTSPWRNPAYLLSKTFGGRRLVPVEIGRSYVDEDWGQELITFKEFLNRYVNPEMESDRNIVQDEDTEKTAREDTQSRPVGYLAQHNLFQQIPSLRNDIHVPDFCWADVPHHPTTPSKNNRQVDVPQLNAWFGPAKTITPLHTDNYHNLLCQVVGTKYVRLYPPRATPSMRPRPPERGVDMSNTSGLDVGVLEGWDPRPEGMEEEELGRMREDLGDVEYRECILEPGDTLVIPIGWWHYVRSLSVSFSVSFWWN